LLLPHFCLLHKSVVGSDCEGIHDKEQEASAGGGSYVFLWKTSARIRFGRIASTSHDFIIHCFVKCGQFFCNVLFLFATVVGVVAVQEVSVAGHFLYSVVCSIPT
jgi:hypothetical protein